MNLTADTITDDQIRAVRAELVQRKRQNAYTRSIRKDCDAALGGDRICRESVATAYNKLRAERLADLKNDDDPAQTRAIDAWIAAVLRRGGVRVVSFPDGSLNLVDVPQKWVAIVDALSAGIHAAARDEELPEVTVPSRAENKAGRAPLPGRPRLATRTKPRTVGDRDQ